MLKSANGIRWSDYSVHWGPCQTIASLSCLGLSCKGKQLTACVNGGKHTRDCSQVATGFSCQHHAGDSDTYYCGLDSTCDPAGNPSCAGSKITICNAGKPLTLDCKSLGFSTCDDTKAGSTRCK